jgi:hypothetical protein
VPYCYSSNHGDMSEGSDTLWPMAHGARMSGGRKTRTTPGKKRHSPKKSGGRPPVGVRVKPCEFCGKPMKYARATKRTCSTRCRVALHRQVHGDK